MLVKALRSKRMKYIELGKTFNLSYYMINSDGKSQSYAHLMVFKKLVAKPRWPPIISTKKYTDKDRDMTHLV